MSQSFSHFSGLQFVAANQEVLLIIGQDNSEALIPLVIKRGKKGEPFASRTIFGWSINVLSRAVELMGKLARVLCRTLSFLQKCH